MEQSMKDTSLEKLLDHDTDDPIPPDHERRIREGLGSLLVPGAVPKPDVPPPPASTLAKWVTLGAVSVVAAGGGFVAGRATAPTPPPQQVIVAAPPTVSTPQFTASVVPPLPTESAPAVASSVAIHAPRPSATTSSDPFDREQSLLERARAALVRHDAAAAAQALDECEQAFPTSRHAEERDYLRIQVLHEMGNTDQMHVQARRFLAKYPTSLLRSRVEPLAN
jgi:hypothetical protein